QRQQQHQQAVADRKVDHARDHAQTLVRQATGRPAPAAHSLASAARLSAPVAGPLAPVAGPLAPAIGPLAPAAGPLVSAASPFAPAAGRERPPAVAPPRSAPPGEIGPTGFDPSPAALIPAPPSLRSCARSGHNASSASRSTGWRSRPRPEASRRPRR